MASTKDSDAAAAAGVATPVSSSTEYRDAVAAASKAPGTPYFGLSADFNDATVGWTAQSKTSVPDPAQLPGQVFTPEQLPDPSVAIRAGLPPVTLPEHLVIDDDEDHPQGPEPWEIGADPRDVRDAIRARLIKDHSEATKAVEDAKATNAASNGTAKKTVSAKPATT